MVNPPSSLISQFPAAAPRTAATAAPASDSSYPAAAQRRRAGAPGSAARSDRAVPAARSAAARNSGAAPTTSMSGSPMIDQASRIPAATGTHHSARSPTPPAW